MSRRLLSLAATACAVAAFSLYVATLLPGQDLGDTASFQTVAGERAITPRDAYPLFFAVTGAFVRLLPFEPAYAANLAAAVCAALAIGLVFLVAAELSGFVAAGIGAALFLATSYTFWSQAIITEVYALHLLMMALSLVALLAWSRKPTTQRLAVFFAVYAISFGNHQSGILFLPGFALFLLVSAPGGPLTMLRPRVIALALGLAALGALQYAWNFAALYHHGSSDDWLSMLRTFWFDVTKSDWRASMVDAVRSEQLGNRIRMYWFDLRQQVGVPGVALACVGMGYLLAARWRAFVLLLALWVVSWQFAFTYNVGDTHVFYLPSHFVVALAAGCGIGWLAFALRLHLLKSPRPEWARPASAALAVLLLAYPAWRGWDAYPVLDRSHDTTPRAYYDRLTSGLGPRDVLVRDLNWQAHNGLDYYSKYQRPFLAVFDAPENLQAFPFLAWTNAAKGFDLVLTADAARTIQGTFGSLFPIEPDARLSTPTISSLAASLPPGTPYVLVALSPYREYPIVAEDVAWIGRAFGTRDGGYPTLRYAAAVGRIGERPMYSRQDSRPFRRSFTIDGLSLEVRIEAWLPDDTIRRAGFGRVLVGRQPALTLDRGASFVAFNTDGTVRASTWAGGILAPQPRYLIRHGAVAP